MNAPSSELTSTTLLRRLGDASDAPAWSRINDRYRPIVVGLARRLGLDDADSADAAQETMTRFFLDYQAGKYERGRGRLRTWLLTIARSRINDLRRARARRGPIGTLSDAGDFPVDDASFAQAWETSQRRIILERALETLRTGTGLTERTIALFEAVVVNEIPPAQVAELMGTSVGDVYLAKNRVTTQLRAIVSRLTAAYEEDHL